MISNYACLQAMEFRKFILFFCDEQEMETENMLPGKVLWRNGESNTKSSSTSVFQRLLVYKSSGTKGKIFFPKLSIFWLINLIQENIFLSFYSLSANLYSLLQFPSTSFTKYIIIYSFPQATISRDTFPIVGISQINHPIWIFFPQYS